MSETSQRPRTRAGAAVSSALAAGRLELPRCGSCGAVQYPPQEFCRECLDGEPVLAPCNPRATVIASAAVNRSYAADFADGGPWFVASVKMDAGPIAFVHVGELLEGGAKVQLVPLVDRLGDGVLGAVHDENEHEALRARFGKRP